jgi:hypothetical protein
LLREVDSNAKPQQALLEGRQAQIVATADKAWLVLQDGLSLRALTAEGKNAEGLLPRVVANWKWVSLQP